jgi:hypothetical protein
VTLYEIAISRQFAFMFVSTARVAFVINEAAFKLRGDAVSKPIYVGCKLGRRLAVLRQRPRADRPRNGFDIAQHS